MGKGNERPPKPILRHNQQILTQNYAGDLHQVDDGLVVPHLRRVPRGESALAPDVDEDARVHGHHDEEGEQVEERPEDQEAPAVERRHGGAVPQVALAVPERGRHQAHEDAHGPDADDQQHHPPLAHLAVQLHGQDGLVTLHGDGQQVGHGRRQADVDQGPAHVPLLLGERAGPGARVHHQVGVGDAREQISRGHVAQEVVDWEVEAAVHEDGRHHHQVGQDDDDGHRQAQSDDQDVPRLPFQIDLLFHDVVEEADVVAVVAAVGHGGHRCGDEAQGST